MLALQHAHAAFAVYETEQSEQAEAAKKQKLKDQRAKSYEKLKGKRSEITKKKKYDNALALIAAMRAEQALTAQ